MTNIARTLLEPCAATIEIEEKERAKRVALREYLSDDQSSKLIIWSDGSHRKTGSGFAVVWCNDFIIDEWECRAFMLDSNFNSNEAEFFGCSEATNIALQLSRKDTRISKVVIYTDSHHCLQTIRDFHLRTPLHRSKFTRQLELAELKTRVKELHSMGIQVIFRWVPGHSDIHGNSRADYLASLASNSHKSPHITLFQPPPNGYLTSISSQTVKKTPLQPAQRVKNQEKDILQQVRYGRIAKKAHNPERIPLNKLYAARIEWSIHETEAGMQKSLLDILEEAVDQEIEDNV